MLPGNGIGCRTHFEHPGARREVAATLAPALRRLGAPRRPLVFLCIGTDRSTGDALGPLVGDRLGPALSGMADVLGTLREPVHASNLEERLERLRATSPEAVVVAVDACLGRAENVGTITAGIGALAPGAGVNRVLPEVGSAFVTGTVNVGGFMEYFVLQNTRLYLVMHMAAMIADALQLVATELCGCPPAASSPAARAPAMA